MPKWINKIRKIPLEMILEAAKVVLEGLIVITRHKASQKPPKTD